ncbi:MAG: arylsulfotransferase family protein [Candidatus Altiarchaeota archaeon]
MKSRRYTISVITLIALTIVALSFALSALTYLLYPVGDIPDVDEVIADSAVSRLVELGYLTEYDIPEKDKNASKYNVTIYEKGKAYDGLNAYCNRVDSILMFMDMEGTITESIKLPLSECKLLEPYDDETALVLSEDMGVTVIRKNQEPEVLITGGYHHDIGLDDKGLIYLVDYELENRSEISDELLVLDNNFVVINMKGEIIKKVSLTDQILKDPILLQLTKNQKTYIRLPGYDGWDTYHTNTIEVIEKDVYKNGSMIFKKGDVLFCIRHINIIGVIDLNKEEIVWTYGPEGLEYPHKPTITPEGNILIFDNGFERGYSSIKEIDPLTKKVVWEYKAENPEDFFSIDRGGVEILPNNNLLITESRTGRVFEITEDGETVWEYYNTIVNDRESGKRRMIYRMVRLHENQTGFLTPEPSEKAFS